MERPGQPRSNAEARRHRALHSRVIYCPAHLWTLRATPRSVQNLRAYAQHSIRRSAGSKGADDASDVEQLGWDRAIGSSAIVLFAGVAFAAEPAPTKTVTFTKDVAPIFQQKCESCHRADGMAPMSLGHLRGRAAVGEVDRRARRRAPDAAVAHRQDRRHPEVQERSLAERRADRHRSSRGWPPARRRAIPKDMPAAEGVGRHDPTWHLAGKLRSTRSRREVAGVHDAGASRRTRGGGRRVRPASPNRAGSARLKSVRSARTRARSRITRSRGSCSRKTCRSGALHQRSERRRRRPVHGMGGRQERRRDASGLGPSDAAELQDHLGDALSRGRRGDQRAHRARRLVLPEGSGAEAPRGACAVQHVLRRRQPARARSTSRRTR